MFLYIYELITLNLISIGLVDTVFTVDSLIHQLELSATMVERAERYELLGNLYRILIPIYEGRRDYPALVQCYSHLFQVSFILYLLQIFAHK